MNQLYIIYAILGLTVLLLAMAAGTIKRLLWLSEPLLATGVGVLVGPLFFNIVSIWSWGASELILEELARFTLAISLMGVAFRLPDRWIRTHWRPLAVILLIGMPLMWVMSSLCGLLILGLPLLQAMLLGAVLTPTDPVVASSIVTGKLAEKRVSENTRHLISAESGANDGLAFLLVMLPALLLKEDTGAALSHWLTVVLFKEVVLSTAGGVLFGVVVGLILVRLYRFEHTHTRSLLAVSLAMAISLLGLAKLLHGDGILAVFAAGLAFNWLIRQDAGHEAANHERIQETMKRFFDVPVFIFFGMVLPVDGWLAAGWPLALFAAAVLLLRRIPVLFLLYRYLSPLAKLRDALFVGWFGPIAVAAMVYATWADVKEGYEELWVLSSAVIFLSIVVHGATATPFTRLYSSSSEMHGKRDSD